MTSYLTLAFKILKRRKFFTFISLFGISMTLVVLMVVTAILDNVFAPREPESRFDRALFVFRIVRLGPTATMSTNPGYGFLDKYVRTLPDVERTAIYSTPESTALYHNGERLEAMLMRTDGDYWQILNFKVLEGRPLAAGDDAQRRFVAVISDRLREQLFGSEKAAGRTLNIDGQRFTIVGVVRGASIARTAAYADVWVPISVLASQGYKERLIGDYRGVVLAHSRDDFPRLRRELATRVAAIPNDDPAFVETRATLDTIFEGVVHSMVGNQLGRAPAIFGAGLAIAAILFMTLPALNLVTINLSRILERTSEIGVRKAFGAPPRSLIWQFVVENVVLTLIGGLIGFALTAIAIAGLNASELIPAARFDINLRIFFYGVLLSAFFGVFSGVYPAWRMSRLDPVRALRGGAL